jgi:hypothetical protein
VTLDLASRLRDLPSVQRRAPWPGYEYVKGWGVFGLPFDSGHVLALRVFPEGDFGPYRTVWHRDPAGDWSIHVDGPRLDTACPRYYGAACTVTGFAAIELTWTGPASLRVRMDSPSLEWTVTATETRTLRFLNTMSARMPLWTRRPRSLVRLRERLAHRLGMGDLQLTGTMPSGHVGSLMPQRMYFVQESKAVLDGMDLGRPIHQEPNPVIGDVRCRLRGSSRLGRACGGSRIRPSTSARGGRWPSRLRRREPRRPTDRKGRAVIARIAIIGGSPTNRHANSPLRISPPFNSLLVLPLRREFSPDEELHVAWTARCNVLGDRVPFHGSTVPSLQSFLAQRCLRQGNQSQVRSGQRDSSDLALDVGPEWGGEWRASSRAGVGLRGVDDEDVRCLRHRSP